jgi:transposase-like protein
LDCAPGDVRCGGRPHGQSSTEGGRRRRLAEFKWTTVQRILTGEKIVAELGRELDIAPSVIRNWARRSEAGAITAVAANEDVVPTSRLTRSLQPHSEARVGTH